ncbi:threonine/serine dehydratase [Pendulispora albinea]|uniref:Pyridoxal-phosphate dependent enzyme n=1 Tax=Pendulispora albinea TaxID=2741071 RepID=A0ABZ2M052_9BACT
MTTEGSNRDFAPRMRVVPSRQVITDRPFAPVSNETPAIHRAFFDDMRPLPARFPTARLREVTLVRAADLDERVDPTGQTRVWYAIESLQVTGSFKVRGALVSIEACIKRAGTASGLRVVAASAGNHGASMAYAASVLGVRATIFVPQGAPAAKCERIMSYGAELRYASSPYYDDAEAAAMEMAEAEGLSFISPYNDLHVIAGNGGSLGYEIARVLGRVPEHVLLPFGGGGLATGVAWSLADAAGETLGQVPRVWGVQSEVSPVMADSLERGAAIERFLPEGPTLAEGLEGGIAADAFARARSSIGGVIVVSEAAIGRAMHYVYCDLGLLVEGSSATALVPLMRSSERFPLALGVRGGDLVVLITGRNVDRATWERAVAPYTAHTARSRD